MNAGKTLFVQLMEFVPWTSFSRIVQRHGGNAGVRTLSCAEQFRAMAFAQLTWRESLRDIEASLSANAGKLYAMGFRSAVKPSTLADANAIGGLGNQMLKDGRWPYCLAGVIAMANLVSAFCRLTKVSGNKGYLQSLGSVANGYADILQPWMDRKNPSNLHALLDKHQEELKNARLIQRVLGPCYVTAVVGPYQYGDSKTSVVFFAKVTAEGHNGVIQQWYASDENRYRMSVPWVKTPAQLAEQMKNNPIIVRFENGQTDTVQIAPWWEPRFLAPRDAQQHYAVESASFEVAQQAEEISYLHSRRIDEIVEAIRVIEGDGQRKGLLESCKQLSIFNGIQI